MNKSFKGQLEDEVVIFFFRRHWSKVLGNFFVIFLVLAFFGLVILFDFHIIVIGEQDLSNYKWLMLSFLTLMVWLLHFQFSRIFYYYLHTVVFTNLRLVIVDKSIFFRDSRESIDVSKIQEVIKKQNGLLPTILNYGFLEVTLSGSETPVVIDLVPTPDHYFKRMVKAKQDMEDNAAVAIAKQV